MNQHTDELDELPELTEEMLAELKQHPTDLHLGPAEVKPIDHAWFIKKYGPKQPGPGIKILDFIIVIFLLWALVLFGRVWIWVLLS